MHVDEGLDFWTEHARFEALVEGPLQGFGVSWGVVIQLRLDLGEEDFLKTPLMP